MFEKIGTKFESWKGEDQKMFEWIGPEFQCLQKTG